jgi:putative methionine-R-sulfoxide reductase with GAF domain
VAGVLDIDSANYGDFDWEDEKELRSLLDEIGKLGQFEWFLKNLN